MVSAPVLGGYLQQVEYLKPLCSQIQSLVDSSRHILKLTSLSKWCDSFIRLTRISGGPPLYWELLQALGTWQQTGQTGLPFSVYILSEVNMLDRHADKMV